MQQIAKVLLSFLLCVTQINPLVVFGQEETTENQGNQTESSNSNPDRVSLSKNEKQIPNSDNTKNEPSLQTPDSSENSEKVPEQIISSVEDSNENTTTDQNVVQHIEFEELPVSNEVEISEVSTPVRVIVSAPKDLISSRENIVLDTEDEEINNFSEITTEENDSEEISNNTGVVSYLDSISENSDDSNEIINNTDIEGLKNEVENITLNPLYEENNEGIIIKEISNDDYVKLNNNLNSTESVQEIPSNKIDNDDSARAIYLGSFDDVYLLQYPDMESAETAVEYYNLYGNFASLDTMVFINQTDEVTPEEEVVSETEMDLYSNPLSELENAVDDLETVYEVQETEPVENSQSIVDVEPGTKSPDRIAVIDTGSNYADYPVVSMLGDSGADVNGHGTRMIDYILEEDPSADIIAIKALGDDGKGDISAVYAAMMYAIESNADIINMSFNAFSTEENAVLKDAVLKANDAGIKVVVSAGNNGIDAKYFTPSGIDEAIVIGSAVSAEDKVTKQEFSNYGETVDYYVLSDSTSEGAARYSSILSEVGQEEIDNAINTGKVFLLDDNFSVTGGNIEDADQSGEFSQNDVAITFMSGSNGKFEDGSTQNVVTYVDAPMVVKYSHTSNVDDTGKQNSNYGNSWTNANITGTDRGSTSQAHVVTIPGAGSLTVELYYNGENGFWGLSDWLSVWAGNYPSYTAASNYNSDGYVTTAMGAPNNNNKFGGSDSGSYTVNGNTLTNMGHTTLTIPGDTVTFGFTSDSYGYGKGYGYYAIVTGNRSVVSGTYKEPVANNDDYKFESWNSKADGTGTTIDIGSVTTSQTVYAKYVDNVIASGTYGCPWKLKGTGELIIGTDGGNCTLTTTYLSFPRWPWSSNHSSVKKAVLKGTINGGEILASLFSEMSNMTEIEGLVNLDTSAVTDMGYMFYKCSSLTSLDLSKFNTSAVTDMSSMFSGCSGLTSLDVSKFNTSAVTSMNDMFRECSKLTNIDLSKFNTSAVTNMSSMFQSCSSLTSLDVSNFETSKVTNMGYMFCYSSKLTSLDLSKFNTSAVTSMTYMFDGCSRLTRLDVSSFNTSAVTNMYYMFRNCSSLTSLDVSNFDTSKVTDMGYMFSDCCSLTDLDVSKFNTSAVTNMGYMFDNCSRLTSLDLSNFNTSKVTNMGFMFSGCYGLTSLDLSSFNTSSVTSMGSMFYSIFSMNLNSIKLGPNFSFRGNNITATYAQALLPTPSSTAPNNGKWELKGNTDSAKQYTSEQMRDKDPQVTAPGEYIWAATPSPVFDTGKNVNAAFKQLAGDSSATYSTSNTTITSIQRSSTVPSGVTTADVSAKKDGSIIAWFETGMIYWYSPSQKVSLNGDASYMFSNFGGTAQIDLNGVDTSNTTNTGNMFQSCSDLMSLDLSGFDTSAVTNMSGMFYNCINLNSVKLGPDFSFRGNNITDTTSQALLPTPSSTAPNNGKWELKGNTDSAKQYTSEQMRDTDPQATAPGEYVWAVNHPPVFDTGKNVNAAFKQLAGDSSATYSTSNTTITSIQRSSTAPSGVTTADVSAKKDGSIIAWFETGTIYWYSPSQKVSLNGDASYMFSNFGGAAQIDLNGVETSTVTTMYSMFNGCSSLTNINLSNFNTSAVTTMGFMFNGCSRLTSLDLSKFNTSKVTNMGYMFSGCSGLMNINLSVFDTSKVTNMEEMFSGCSGLTNLDLSNFNTSAVTNMGEMFEYCSGLTGLDLSSFNTSDVLFMDWMFYSCSGLTSINLSSFNTSAVTNMFGMFEYCSSLTNINLSNFNTSAVTTMGFMFSGCYGLTSLDLSNFNTSAVTDMDYMFWNCSGLTNLNLSNFNTSAVTRMDNMFNGCSSLTNINLSGFDTSKVTNQGDMFSRCYKLKNINLGSNFSFRGNSITDSTKQALLPTPSSAFPFGGKWELKGNTDTSKQYTPEEMRDNDPQKTEPGWYVWAIVSNGPVFDTGKNVNVVFKQLSGLTSVSIYTESTTITSIQRSATVPASDATTSDISLTKDGSIVAWFDNGTIYWYSPSEKVYMNADAPYMFYNFKSATTIDLSGVDTSNTTNMAYMFYNCSRLANLDISNFNTSAVTNMDRVFYNCSSLTSLDLSKFNTSSVKNMNSMFYNCSNLTNLNLSSFNTSSVTDMSFMFSCCFKLKNINLGSNFSFRGNSITNSTNQALLPTLNAFPLAGKWELKGNTDTSKQYTSEEMRDNDPQVSAPGEYICSKQPGIDAPVFDTGQNVDVALKQLSGQTSPVYNTVNTKITSIQRSTTAPASGVTTADVSFDKDGSIVAWIDNGAIYWYSPSEKVYMNGNASCMFDCFKSATNISLSGVDTSNTTNMQLVFANCPGLTSLDLSNFETSKVTNMYGVFYKCSSLTNLDLSHFNTSKVTDMRIMFSGCSSLTSLDISNFNTSKVTNMQDMFLDATNLKSINLGSNFSFRGNNITDTAKQALLPAPSSTAPNNGKWELNGNTDIAKQYTSEQMRDTDPQTTALGEYIWVIEVNGNTITFMANGGSGTMDPQVISESSTLNTNTFIAPTGYTFGGWATSVANATVGTVAYTDGGNITPSGDITLYSIWKKNITFYSGNNKTTATIVEQYYDGANLTGSNITTPSATTCENISSWTELGWRDDSTAGAKEVDFNTSISPTSTDYYAVYSRDLTLSYNGNGNTGGSASANGTFTQRYNTNGAITSPAFTLANNTFTKTKYIFNDWDLGTPGTTYTAWNPAVSDTTVTKTAYAQWLRQDNVSVNCQVTGNLGSRDKLFTYTVAFANTDTPYENQTINYTLNGLARTLTLDSSAQGTIELSSNDTATFQEILEGTTFTVTQQNYAADGYTVNHLSVTKTLSNTDYNVTFTNENVLAVPTGINKNNSLAVFIIFLMGILGIFCIGIRKFLSKR